jgi:hypothetical protein
MFDSLASARSALDEIARDFDASALSPQAALRVVDELGVIRRVVDGMTAKAAKRAIDGDAHVGFAAKAVARTLVSPPARSAPRSRPRRSSRACPPRIEPYEKECCRRGRRS